MLYAAKNRLAALRSIQLKVTDHTVTLLLGCVMVA
jgi:hypothetical protein